MKRITLKIISCFLMLGGATSSHSAPELDYPLTIVDGTKVTVTGVNFGDKAQAAPILLDHVDRAYENGVVNNYFGSLGEDAEVKSSLVDEKSLYLGPSNVGPGSTHMLITHARESRLEGGGSHYYAQTGRAWVGWPLAYGSSDTPVDNEQLYVSWWFKIKHDPRYYWRVKVSDFQDGFSIAEGDQIEVENTTLKGYAVALVDDDLTIVFPDQSFHSRELRGNRAFNTSATGSALIGEEGYLSPGSNKYLRVWEDPTGSSGVRLSWTQNQLHKDWVAAPMTPGEWHHMEFYVDTGRDLVRAYTDGTLVGETVVGTESKPNPAVDGKWSPTMALLGWDGVQEHQHIEMDDIYMDLTLQRVIVSDAAKFEDVKYYEVQRPEVWEDGKVEFVLNRGTLQDSEAAYVYIFDSTGTPNAFGLPLCDDCLAKPAKPVLTVTPVI